LLGLLVNVGDWRVVCLGSIALARSEAREQALVERLRAMGGYGSGLLIGPAEIESLHPLVDTEAAGIRRGLFYPGGHAGSTGRLKAVQAMCALAATAGGNIALSKACATVALSTACATVALSTGSATVGSNLLLVTTCC
jgi:hypothetical protein